MYKVELRRRAQRTLDRLPQTDFEAVVEAVKELAQTPRPRGVTTLSAKADSFLGHALTNVTRYAPSPPSEGQDI
jgi:mRNA-degrading endonuclease RelE of RelBE toxin-antitoxin system